MAGHGEPPDGSDSKVVWGLTIGLPSVSGKVLTKPGRIRGRYLYGWCDVPRGSFLFGTAGRPLQSGPPLGEPTP
ncbi:hypothetical protein GCM10010228_01440 [Streptomyces massasporeus]|nr:hypothetical protein GCM10010228_01440 [Streptomyces massasporeus]